VKRKRKNGVSIDYYKGRLVKLLNELKFEAEDFKNYLRMDE
jgi:hypothetical protein